MTKIVIYGAGALARQIIKYNERYGLYNIVALIDDNKKDPSFCGIPVFSYEEFKRLYPSADDLGVIVSIGYAGCNTARASVCKRLSCDGVKLRNFISPGSNCWPGSISGTNVIVFDNVFIGVDCIIGDGVIVSEGTILSHGIKVGEYTFFSDGVVVGGNAHIGNNCFIGLNATIKSSVNIGDFNIVGSSANVLDNTEDYSITKGNPGRSSIVDTPNIKI